MGGQVTYQKHRVVRANKLWNQNITDSQAKAPSVDSFKKRLEK